MPAKQMQKTRLAATTTKTAITQKQSLEIVQTLLHGGLSSLTYLRSLFAEKAFSQQFYEMSSRVPSYRDYADGKLSRRSGVQQTTMKVLRRGRSQRADKFLDWLEDVAFVALQKGTLRALQIFILTDPKDREKVVETYTFTIKYHINAANGQTITGLEVESPGSPPLTVEATNAALQEMLRDIMRVCQDLPDLPPERFMSMTVHYMHVGDEGFELKGWVPITSDHFRFAAADGWERTTSSVKELHSAFHSATLNVTHLHQPAFHGMSGIMQATLIPTRLNYSDIVMNETEIEATTFPEAGHTTITPSTVVPSEHEAATDRGITTPAATAAARLVGDSPAIVSKNEDTQTSNAPRMKNALQGFMLPERLTQGDTQTQQLMRPPLPPSENGASKAMTTTLQKMLTLPQIATKLKVSRPMLRQAALKLAKPSNSRENGADVLLCQCGHLEEEGGVMIGCSYCDTWQHFHCYGYTGPDDPRVPDNHACYQCLLAGEDEDALSALKDLALRRRGMSFALRIGLWRKGNLAKEMDVDAEIGRGIHDYLRTEGFVVNVYKSHKPGFAATGKPLFIPVTEGPSHDKLIRDLFNPLLHIEDYYATPLSPLPLELIGRQLYAIRPADMPAPSTPHRKKKESATPASNLDLRSSMTPYETPVLSHFPPRKRQSDNQAFFDTPAKRRSTGTPLYYQLRSIQTAMILNADGMSSSPATNNR